MISENSLMMSLATTGDGVFAVDGGQRIVLWNRGAEDILEYTAAEVIGKNCVEVIQGADESGQVVCTRDCPISSRVRTASQRPRAMSTSRESAGVTRWFRPTT